MAGKIFSDIYTESARDTGDQTTSHITYVKKKANDALREICAEMNYSWLQRETDLTLVASTASYAMATAAPLWDEDTPLRIYYRNAAQERQYLEALDDAEWESKELLREGLPFCFNVSMKTGAWKVYLSEVPNAAFVSSYSPLQMQYQKKPTELSAAGDIPELPTSHHQALVYWTNVLICTEMGDTTGAGEWMALAQKSLGKMNKKQVHRLGRPKRVYPRSYLGGRSARGRRDYNL